MTNVTVTVVGLGAMGLPMATNLARTFHVRGVDVQEARLELGREAGLEVHTDAPEAARGADVVLLAVRNQHQLEAALFGEKGVADELAAGATVILTSTVGIDAIAAVRPGLAERGIHLVDAPVSGGPARAGEGDLLVTVGADDAAWEAGHPVLDEMASTLYRVGDEAGKGQAMKTVNQLLCGIHIAAAGEAMALAGKMGLNQNEALEALMSGAASSFMLGDRGPRMLQAYDETPAEVKSRLDIFVKDMGIVVNAARRAGIGVPLAAAAEQTYLHGLTLGLGAADDSSVIRTVTPEDPAGEGNSERSDG
ncbi:NAD(P)-dependent oxidoreductase [Corynebacterium frankenforstense]|uniref:NAD(P)-dependent oxidoreductase n=1 Tax=Corynebacterium TaxID=1716 RepID=UPI00254E7C8D|nr:MULTISPECIES: NAD(P)-dependent oxidoreductase [Corynebacterium]MDK6259504.1 NAD(P)-dependent oxidoreductase [Corynebacterium frankenforstense]MDK8895071.1 NAD(P)-dependent oxidoreductase [Corynebacterium sp. MSK006]